MLLAGGGGSSHFEIDLEYSQYLLLDKACFQEEHFH